MIFDIFVNMRMAKIIFLYLAFTSLGTLSLWAQGMGLSRNPDTFGQELNELLRGNGEQTSDSLASNDFATLWQGSSLTASQKNQVIDIFHRMVEKGYNVRPYLSGFSHVLNQAIEIKQLGGKALDDFLEVSQHMLDDYSPGRFSAFLKLCERFFEQDALYVTGYHTLYARGGSFRFEYVAQDALAQLPEEQEVPPEEENATNEDNWFSDWDTNEDSDGWGDTDDWDASDWNATPDPAMETQDTESALIQGAVVSEIKGPLLRFENTDLIFASKADSTGVEGATGAILLDKLLFVGEKGRFNWAVAGLPADEVYADFSAYEFDVTRAAINAEDVELHYKGVLEEPVVGVFEYRSEYHEPDEPVSYPRFKSYRSGIKINLFDKNIDYRGGLSLKGAKINSASILEERSFLKVSLDGKPHFRAVSRLFTIEDSVIHTDRAAVVLYHNLDSIVHPAVQLSFHSGSYMLTLLRDKGGYRYTPYESRYFNMDFTADMIKWDLNNDSLNISILEARNQVPARFESIDYYDERRIDELSDYLKFNPLYVVVSYARKINASTFYASDISDQYNLEEKDVRSGMIILMQNGFIDYDLTSGEINVRRKAYHNMLSKQRLKDFDNMLIESKDPTSVNATLDVENNELTIRGIDRFYISKELDVSIVPQNSEATLLENRKIRYDGKIFAGRFEFTGKEFTFDYDDFLVDLQQIDSIQFYIYKELPDGRVIKEKIENNITGKQIDTVATDSDLSAKIDGTSGTLYINMPDNKSGAKIHPQYPIFDAESGSQVNFGGSEILGGAYAEGDIHFDVPAFKIDSLSDSDPSAIGFDGTFRSKGMLPDFDANLSIREDNSLGFTHRVPDEGYDIYNGKGKFFKQLKMDNDGVRGNGSVEYLNVTLKSEDFIFYPDSMVTYGQEFKVTPGNLGPASFPDISVDQYYMHWEPYMDSMYIANQSDPFTFYGESLTLDGHVGITPYGVSGGGNLTTRGSDIKSEEYFFKESGFSARNANFRIKSDNANKSALLGLGVKVDFDLDSNSAIISPERAGEAAVTFPYAQFKTSIPTAKWDLTNKMVMMEKPEDVPIEESYFYTTRSDLDSLVFNATRAEYDIESLELKVSGIPHIVVADAKIIPEGNEILIHENASIGTLTNASIVLDTLYGYHNLFDATVKIISRNKFEGEATLEYVNAAYDTFAIKVTNFHLVEEQDRKEIRQHTEAVGAVTKYDSIFISPGMVYKGDIRLIANKPALQLDGFVKLDLQNIPDYDTWIQYSSNAEQQEVEFLFEEAIDENGKTLTAGLHFTMNNELYGTFVTDKQDPTDLDFFVPSGVLSFDKDANKYIIEEPAKTKGESYAGKSYSYNDETTEIQFEGPFQFISGTPGVELTAAGRGKGTLNDSEFTFDTFLSLNFDLPVTAYQIMAEDMAESLIESGAPEAIRDRSLLMYKMAEIIGDRATRNYEENSIQEYTALLTASPQLIQPFTFSDIIFKWSDAQHAWYSTGKLGLSNSLRTDINAAVDGFFEIRKTMEGDEVHLFLQATPASWYYFGYQDNELLTYSSNPEYNEFIASKSNAGKAKIGEFRFLEGDTPEVLQFVNRFRKVYLGIDENYELDDPDELRVEDEQFDTIIEDQPAEPFDLPEEIIEEEEETDDGF